MSLLFFLMGFMMIKVTSSCSYFALFDYRYAIKDKQYKYKYTQNIQETRFPEEAKEEAIMLIGGMINFEDITVKIRELIKNHVKYKQTNLKCIALHSQERSAHKRNAQLRLQGKQLTEIVGDLQLKSKHTLRTIER